MEKNRYTVTYNAERMMPQWLAKRINYKSVSPFYRIRDGTARFIGIRIGEQIAEIGDTIILDRGRLSVRRKDGYYEDS